VNGPLGATVSASSSLVVETAWLREHRGGRGAWYTSGHRSPTSCLRLKPLEIDGFSALDLGGSASEK
jgi:hypothetical protein